MPGQSVAVLAVGRVAEVQVGQDLDGEVAHDVGLLALRRRARRLGLLAAGSRNAQRSEIIYKNVFITELLKIYITYN